MHIAFYLDWSKCSHLYHPHSFCFLLCKRHSWTFCKSFTYPLLPSYLIVMKCHSHLCIFTQARHVQRKKKSMFKVPYFKVLFLGAWQHLSPFTFKKSSLNILPRDVYCVFSVLYDGCLSDCDPSGKAEGKLCDIRVINVTLYKNHEHCWWSFTLLIV